MKFNKIVFLASKNGIPFANNILNFLNEYLNKENMDLIELTEVIETKFANTEIKAEIKKSIRDTDCYIVQDVSNKENGYSVNDNLFATLSLINAAKISCAKRITVILPTFPYARQDKIFGREGLSAKIITNILELSGADKIITLDLHNKAIVGFFNKAIIENLFAERIFTKYLLNKVNINNLVVSSPDIGGIKAASSLAKNLQAPLVTIYKERNYSKANNVESMELIGKVVDKDVILVDDILDTGGTLVNAVNLLKEKGANKVYFFVSLCLLNDPAVERINKLYLEKKIDKIITTDAVYHTEETIKKYPWLETVPISKYFAEVIFNLHLSRSIAKVFEHKKEKSEKEFKKLNL
jgi:ribose-phosphate pyrophosphokinase